VRPWIPVLAIGGGKVAGVLSLVLSPGTPDEQSFVLPMGSVTIGRTRDNQVFCTHKSLSRRHAQVDYDGKKVRIADLQSKNGIYFNGKRVPQCELVEGDSFRCGDIMILVEGATTRQPKISVGVQTLPSPLLIEQTASKRPTKIPAPAVLPDEDGRYKDKLFLLIRASELLVGDLPVDKMLEELIVMAVQVIEVDRMALLTLDDETLDIKPRVVKSFAGGSARPYSKRVVDYVVDKGSPTSFIDVSKDRALPGDIREDANVRAAMAAPVNPGNGTIGVLYADSMSKVDIFKADDLALFRALANLAALSIEGDNLRRNESQSGENPAMR